MIYVWDLRNSHAPERVSISLYQLTMKPELFNLWNRHSRAMSRAYFRWLGATRIQICFSLLAKTTATFAGTPKSASLMANSQS